VDEKTGADDSLPVPDSASQQHRRLGVRHLRRSFRVSIQLRRLDDDFWAGGPPPRSFDGSSSAK